MSETKECNVCCEDRTLVKCNVCEFEACQECIQRYLLDAFQDKHCMKCRNGWSNEFVYTNLKPSFLGGAYWKHRKECMFNEEKMRFSEYMRLVELDREIPRLTKKDRKYRKKIMTLLQQDKLGVLLFPDSKKYRKPETIYGFYYSAINMLYTILPIKEEDIIEYNDKELLRNYYLCVEYHNRLMHYAGRLNRFISERNEEFDRLGGASNSKKKKAYTFPCPREGCLGLINPNTEEKHYACPVCSDKLCKRCYVPIKEGHKCDKSVVATMREIMKDSKPCPECKTPISRISGCPQMWCVVCHTAFNYNTGEKVVGVVHNPHYFEYRRNHGETRNRQQVRDLCGNGVEDITVYSDKLAFEVRSIKRKAKKKKIDVSDKTSRYRITLEYYYRLCADINESFRSIFDPVDVFVRNKRLNRRIEYLLNNYQNDKQFKTNILRERRDDEIRNYMYVLCTTVYMLLCGAFREYIEEVSDDAYPHFEEKCWGIIKHFNECSYNERRYMKYNTYYKLEQADGKYFKMYLLRYDGKKTGKKRGPRVVEPGEVEVDDGGEIYEDEVIEID